MKKWVWHIGLAAIGGIIAACTSSDDVAGSSFETENSVAVTVRHKDGSPAARTKVLVRPSDFLAGANNLPLDNEYANAGSPVVKTDSAAGILNLETNEQGRLDLRKLKPGSYAIEARQDSGKAVTFIDVTDSTVDSVALNMTSAGAISGQVFLPENVSSVTVGIKGLDYFVETDDAGNFKFTSIPEGAFSVVGFVFRTYKTLDLNGKPSTYSHYQAVGSSRAKVESRQTVENLVIGQEPPAPDTVAKDTNIYPVVAFEDFEDSACAYNWYTNVSKYASAKLGIEEDLLDRGGSVAHFEYSNDSNYNWVLMGRSLHGPKDLSSLDSVVFWARAGLGDSTQWISLSFDVQMDSVELEKYKEEGLDYENGKAWVHMSLDTTWQRFVVTPGDLLETDSLKNGGNIGWDAVKDHVTNLNFFGGGVGNSFEMWIDDIVIYGVKELD